MFQVKLDTSLQSLVRHLPPSLKKAVKESLRGLAKNPTLGKPLQDNLEGLYSYRIRGFRLIYSLSHASRMIKVIALGPRKNIYQDVETFLVTRH